MILPPEVIRNAQHAWPTKCVYHDPDPSGEITTLPRPPSRLGRGIFPPHSFGGILSWTHSAGGNNIATWAYKCLNKISISQIFFLLKHFLRISHVATALNAKSRALKYPSPYDATRDKNVTK